MDNQLIVHLKTDDRIEGKLARPFRNNDADIAILVAGEQRKLVFSLDEICCIRFLRPPAMVTAGEPATVEEVRTITGEAYRVAVFTRQKFLKGFIGLLQDEAEMYRTIFFSSSGIRYRHEERFIGQILQDKGFVSNDKIEEVLKTQGELRTRRMGEVITASTDLVQGRVEQTIQEAAGNPVIPRYARVGDILVEAGLVTREQVEKAFRNQQGDKKLKVGEILIKQGLITEHQLLSALATKFRLRFVNIENVIPSEEALGAISEGLANRLQVLPIELDGRKLVVATSTPTDQTVGDSLRFSTNYIIELVVAYPHQIAAAIYKYYRHGEEAVDALLESMQGEAESAAIEEELE